jgi:hypothetical protein
MWIPSISSLQLCSNIDDSMPGSFRETRNLPIILNDFSSQIYDSVLDLHFKSGGFERFNFHFETARYFELPH